ncbi:MAG: TIGR03089 family protein [Kutzneria sp.]|nr:TIGR03089 family protein [Kutzneria sp.]
MSVTERLFLPYLKDPSRPVITHYDDTLESRVELSAATVANWAAKTANWLRDELDVELGDSVAVLLPGHWQTLGVLLGAWWCGARITGDPDSAVVTFVGPDGATSGSGTTAVVALDPMGRGLDSPPGGGALDYVTESRIFGDDFAAYAPVTGDAPALDDHTIDEVTELASRRAGELGIGPNDRVLSTMDWSTQDGLVDGLLAVLSAGATLVQCSNLDPDLLARRRATERTTVDLFKR